MCVDIRLVTHGHPADLAPDVYSYNFSDDRRILKILDAFVTYPHFRSIEFTGQLD
jgi:hypothetical protein